MRSRIAQRIYDETPTDVRIFVRKYNDIVVRIFQILRQKGWTQKDLAMRLDKNASEISKWLNAKHNLTLKSIAKLEAELGEEIIYVPKRDSFHVQRCGNLKSVAPKSEPVSTRVQFLDAKKKPTTPSGSPIAA
jgi:transcriptional regulator with XRE-family HTH domain